MSKQKGALSLILVLIFIVTSEAVTPIFLQAIASALATIPFTGGPMTTGLIGAKLGIGTKLLYYLGYFGRGTKRTSVPKPSPKPPNAKATPKLPGGLQPLPLPYILSGAGRFPQMGGGGFGGPSNFQQMGGGGFGGPATFQQMGGGGFGGPANFQQMPFGGFEPSQVFQALRAQGFDANTIMQLMNYGAGFGMGGGGGFGMNGGFGQNVPNFPSNIPNMGSGGFGQNMAGLPSGVGGGFNPGSTGFPAGTPQEFLPDFQPIPNEVVDVETNAHPGMGDDAQPPTNAESESSEEPNDIESFFTFLQDMDDNGCISRLICDIGADPSFLGDFSENIHGIVGSLDVQPSSRAYPYIQIMESGKEGGCSAKFPQCSDSAYGVVKSIAPTVGVPENINAAAVNSL